jgi:hypothetical protein
MRKIRKLRSLSPDFAGDGRRRTNFPATKNARHALGRGSGADMPQWHHEPQEDGVTTYTFLIVVEPDEDRWRAYAPALEAQGASTWGYPAGKRSRISARFWR